MGRKTLILLVNILPGAYLVSLWFSGQDLYDPRPWVNLPIRFYLMDLCPVLWTLQIFGVPARGFFQKLFRQGVRRSALLAAPVLALVLFLVESLRAVRDPATAQAVTLTNVLWMEGAAVWTVFLLLASARSRPGLSTAARWSSFGSFIVLLAGGAVYFFDTGCDISRLLVLIGIAAWSIQKVIDFLAVRNSRFSVY